MRNSTGLLVYAIVMFVLTTVTLAMFLLTLDFELDVHQKLFVLFIAIAGYLATFMALYSYREMK